MPLSEKVRAALQTEHKRIVGLWRAQVTNAKAGAAPGLVQKERRLTVGKAKKSSAVAGLLVEMARRVVERPEGEEPPPGGEQEKPPEKPPEGGTGGGDEVPAEESVKHLRKRLTHTERLGEALLTRARKEQTARLRLEARYQKLKELSQALLDRGRWLMKQLGRGVEEGTTGAESARPERPRRRVAESTAAAGVVDPAGRRLPAKRVATGEPPTIIEGLAKKGL
jgi:hypothetical protein